MKTDLYTKVVLTIIAIALVADVAISTGASRLVVGEAHAAAEPMKIQICRISKGVFGTSWECGK